MRLRDRTSRSLRLLSLRLLFGRPGAALLAAVLLSGCATGLTTADRGKLHASLAGGDYTAAAKHIRDIRKRADEGTPTYGKKNEVLYRLDLGTVLHEAGLHRESDTQFAAAEDRMEDLYTQSLSREAGRFMVNDATVEYAGERYERVLLHVYRALNHLGMGERDGALVEIRKLSRLLQEYRDTVPDTVYSDDAFAQYLSALLYADVGQRDDARIAMEAAQKAYDAYRKHYGTRPPEDWGAAVSEDAAELVFIHGNGVAPHKVSRTMQVAWNNAAVAIRAHGDRSGRDEDAEKALNIIHAGLYGNAFTLTYPVYVSASVRIASSTVEVGASTGDSFLAEDIAAIAKQDLKERMDWVLPRAIARAAVKQALTQSLARKTEKDHGAGAALLVQLVAAATSAATEVADTRGWSTLPAQFRLARVRVPLDENEREQTVTVHYRDGNGNIVFTRSHTVKLKRGARTYLYDRTAQ